MKEENGLWFTDTDEEHDKRNWSYTVGWSLGAAIALILFAAVLAHFAAAFIWGNV